MGNVTLHLVHDTGKELKAGKRRYVDDDGHQIYLVKDEVDELGGASEIDVVLAPRPAA